MQMTAKLRLTCKLTNATSTPGAHTLQYIFQHFLQALQGVRAVAAPVTTSWPSQGCLTLSLPRYQSHSYIVPTSNDVVGIGHNIITANSHNIMNFWVECLVSGAQTMHFQGARPDSAVK